MSKKKLIISGLCMALLSVMPVQAAEDFCTHPVWAVLEYRGYHITTDQHQKWTQGGKKCTTCGAEERDDIQYEDWEDHDWYTWNPEHGNTGQTVWEGRCTICGYEDTVITYP